jgi:hypothetical protein
MQYRQSKSFNLRLINYDVVHCYELLFNFWDDIKRQEATA